MGCAKDLHMLTSNIFSSIKMFQTNQGLDKISTTPHTLLKFLCLDCKNDLYQNR